MKPSTPLSAFGLKRRTLVVDKLRNLRPMLLIIIILILFFCATTQPIQTESWDRQKSSLVLSWVHYNMGNELLAKGQYDQAIPHFDSSLP